MTVHVESSRVRSARRHRAMPWYKLTELAHDALIAKHAPVLSRER